MRRLVALIVVLILVTGIVSTLSLSTEATIRARALNTAHRLLIESNWTDALQVIESAEQTISTFDWELSTWKAVILKKLEQPTNNLLERSLTATSNEDVWITYGMVANLVAEPTLVLRAGEELIALNANSVQGRYLIAQAYDTLEQFDTALHHYELVLQIAGETSGDEGIYLAVRQRVAQINLLLLEQGVFDSK